jgi:hypothetical protein
MRPNMISATAQYNLPGFGCNAVVKSCRQLFRDFAIFGLVARQIVAKKPAENRLHSGLPKTS